MSDRSHAERRRVLAENDRRRREVDGSRYAPWNRAERLMVDGRAREAAALLHRQGVFPTPETRCLEIGFGEGGWLPTLLSWGLSESRLYGVEIDPLRAVSVRRRLPSTSLCLADGGTLPFVDGAFGLVIVSTVFTSVLEQSVRSTMAGEIQRVLAPGGALLWYDFAVDNPRNPHVRGVGRRELKALFPELRGEIRSITLAPPILRPVSRWSVAAAELLSALPFLRSHLLAVLTRDA